MRSLLLVAFGVLVLSSAWWWQQRSMSDCCLQVVEPVIMIEEPDAEPLPPVAKPAPPVVLDLTVPADVVSGEPLPESGDNRFGSEQWFAPKEKTESSVKFKRGIRISWLIFSLACNHRLHFPNGKTGWRGLEQMRKDCGTREFIAHPSVYLERSLSANLSDVPLTADNTRMEFST